MLRAGKSQKEVAQFFGVSEGAISKAKKELNVAVVKSVVLENAHRVTNKTIDAVTQLQSINEKANSMLDELMGEDKLIDRMVKAVQGAITYESEPVKQTAYIRGIVKQITEDRFLALKAMQEIRGQLTLQLDIFKTLYDLEAVAEFQREVLNTIGEVSPDVRDRIIQRLKESRALRQSVSIN
jgi:transcriptional regulator with XRE-family HTH domain